MYTHNILKAEQEEEEREQENARRDPREAAERHGNKPSRGAEIDAELQRDDELRLKEKGQAWYTSPAFVTVI